MAKWKRLFFVALVSFIVVTGFNITGGIAFDNVVDIANKATAKVIEYEDIIINQAHTIAEQSASIQTYEQMLDSKGQGFSRSEAIEFVSWCIQCHEYYYDPASCNEYTGFPSFHKEVNGQYGQLLEYIKSK